ncbi:hypothetical protein A4A49_55016 [Nicotiana attenuata]|uniref:Uncharacterized protein n=1 Tax=Nicotiana attenuata TaxID=49451 RepID=A0A314L7W8_NICAT|nr:hypothetical protein A4A49_55016 [Nicotiana attenuata]
MQIKQSRPVGLFQSWLVILVFLSLLFVSAAKNNTVVAQKQPEEEEAQQPQNWKLRHSLDVFFPSKRRVPNESDPLHNR